MSASPANDAGVADTIYTGGAIITMDDANPTAEAVAVKDGKIAAVGSAADVLRLRGPSTRVVELGSRTLVPGFLDGHSHFFQAVQMAGMLNVSSPPVGTARSIADIAALVKARADQAPPGEWIIGYGYDGTCLTDGRELTRDDLDPAAAGHPVVLFHVSMHGGVLNSAAFQAVGIDASTPTPPGGVTLRKPGGNEPAGLLMEQSWLPVWLGLPKPSQAQLLENLKAAQDIYASNGYTTAQDAPVEPAVRPLYQAGADQGRFFLDLVGYAMWAEFSDLLGQGTPFGGPYQGHYRIAGMKVVCDGSPQGKTGFFSRPYLTDGPSGEKDWCGEPNVAPEELNRLVKLAYEHDVQVLAHCNGDAAIQMMLDAHAAAGAPADRHTVIIHSQFVRPDQLDKYVEYGISPSFFTNHTFFWGDVHVENLGQERAYFLSPMRTARAKGLRMTNHSDSVVTPLDPALIMWTAVNRTSRSGTVIGPDERITPHDALRALTIDAAHQYSEEATKGSLTPGKLADLVILSANPLTIDPTTLADVKVLETIKEGRTIYQRDGGA